MQFLCRFKTIFIAFSMLAGPLAAATVTTNESQLDAIFAQPGFTNPIDIRFLDQIDINAPRFLNVDTFEISIDTNGDGIDDTTETRSEMDFLLFGAIPQLSETDRLYMIFVDSINVCGTTRTPGIVGCAIVGGNRQVLEAGWAADSRYGAELQAHEMVHNLGVLNHTEDGTGLMGARLNRQTDLSASEIRLIEMSSLVLRDTAGSSVFPYINVQPVRIFDASLDPAAVPAPPAGLALVAGLGVMVARRRRRRR